MEASLPIACLLTDREKFELRGVMRVFHGHYDVVVADVVYIYQQPYRIRFIQEPNAVVSHEDETATAHVWELVNLWHWDELPWNPPS